MPITNFCCCYCCCCLRVYICMCMYTLWQQVNGCNNWANTAAAITIEAHAAAQINKCFYCVGKYSCTYVFEKAQVCKRMCIYVRSQLLKVLRNCCSCSFGKHKISSVFITEFKLGSKKCGLSQLLIVFLKELSYYAFL